MQSQAINPSPLQGGKATASAPRTVRVTMGEQHALAILFPDKGHAAKVERFFDAVAPILSTWLATGGNKTDFQQTGKHGALVSALWAAHATGKGTAKRIGAAWAALAAHALTIPGKAFAFDQSGHDSAILDAAAMWLAYFPAPAARVKDATAETSAQKIARLEAECAALVIERDALAAALKAVAAPASETATAT